MCDMHLNRILLERNILVTGMYIYIYCFKIMYAERQNTIVRSELSV